MPRPIALTKRNAIRIVQKEKVLLSFPLKGKPELASLWSRFFPGKTMHWSWEEDADDYINDLWVLMKELSGIEEVIYSKWYQGRVTLFAPDLFIAMLAIHRQKPQKQLIAPARQLLSALELDSPLSTKQLKKAAELTGKDNLAAYNRGLRTLFQSFLIVGYGEEYDGAFPSARMAATRHVYDEFWYQAERLSLEEAWLFIETYLPKTSPWRRFFDRTLRDQ